MIDDIVKEAQLAMWTSYCDMKMELQDAKDRIEQLEAIMKKLVEPFKKAAPLFGAQYVRSIKVGDQVVEELLAALEEKNDD